MRKSTLVTVAFLVYLAVMAVIGWKSYILNGQYWQYFTILGVSLVVIFLLRTVLRKRENRRRESRKRRDASDRRCYRDDQIL